MRLFKRKRKESPESAETAAPGRLPQGTRVRHSVLGEGVVAGHRWDGDASGVIPGGAAHAIFAESMDADEGQLVNESDLTRL